MINVLGLMATLAISGTLTAGMITAAADRNATAAGAFGAAAAASLVFVGYATGRVFGWWA
jgi:hypothetical protein